MKTPTTPIHRRGAFPAMLLLAALAAACSGGNDNPVSETTSNVRGASIGEKQLAEAEDAPVLVGRAVLPASTFAPGPRSGQYLGSVPVNGQAVPFPGQPVQGFSAVARNPDGSFDVMADNGYGSLENSADFNLRVYRVAADFKLAEGGSGSVQIDSFIELSDPNRKIPFVITNEFIEKRILTGADFDIESMQRAADGTLWFGDEFGPFLIHTDATGVVLEAPIALPDFDNPGKEIRSPQSPLAEESTAVRIMNAVRAHAFHHGATRTPGFSPYEVMLKYDTTGTAGAAGVKSSPDAHYARGSNAQPGLTPATSEIHDIASMKTAGFKVVPYTVNDPARMTELLKAGVSGLISDRPDLLVAAVRSFDANGDGMPGDYLTADGLVDIAKFDAQGHRGARDLRPENTLPAFEAALDALVPTLELDSGMSSDYQLIVKHDPYIEAAKCRRADGQPYGFGDEVLIKDLTRAHIQSMFVCDKLFRGPDQQNDLTLSPVSVALARARGLANPYVAPTVGEVFDLVESYADYYEHGDGKSHPASALRAKNARQVRLNIETKINPRADLDAHGIAYKDRTVGFEPMADALASLIASRRMETRADIQSFDFRTLLRVQERFPSIRTVYLFGDFPIYPDVANSDDGTNMQGEGEFNTPWMAGMRWPYRSTSTSNPFRAARSGGFEGMALTVDGRTLLPLLEQPLTGSGPKTLLIHEFDLAKTRYTGRRWPYVLEPRGTNIGDFIMHSPTDGIVIERDGSQGDLDGFKKLYSIKLAGDGSVEKTQLVDLLRIRDPNSISGPSQPGDVGLGDPFAMPFSTIEDVLIIDPRTLLVIDDNNFPFSVGRHLGSQRPDDSEFVLIALPRTLNVTPR